MGVSIMSKRSELNQSFDEWANTEFEGANFGDQRLTARLIKIADSLGNLPECSINQACGNWVETKAAYRFFQNGNISESEILKTHVDKTVERSKQHKKILDIQDTCYMTYTSHKKTSGLGTIVKKEGVYKKLQTEGLIMHTSFAVTTEGLPLGILDQKIYARPQLPEKLKGLKKKSHGNGVSIEEKESIRWVESLIKSNNAMNTTDTEVISICDREADMYDFFEAACRNKSLVLVRAAQNRKINQIYLHSRKENETLWSFIKRLPSQGKIRVEVPKRDGKVGRVATLDLHFSSFTMNPPRNNIRLRTEELPDLNLQVIYVIEKHPPKGEKALEWILLTNLPVQNFSQALEKVRWYCLRWRIETFHKILKSGLRVEECRLGTAKRLMRYLTVMSIIAWRIFFITLIGRTSPNVSCAILLTEMEWKVLFAKIHKTFSYPKIPPSIKEAIRWIAQLGGFLGRKGDGDPGPITVWRGLKRLTDLVEGADMSFA
jgi:hypothetical protein